MKHLLTGGLLCASLSACATISGVAERIGIGAGQDVEAQPGAPVDPFTSTDVPRTQTGLDPATAAPPPPAAARTAEALDTTTAAQRATAASPATGGTETPLGRTVVTLGSATEPGLWMKTPLVEVERQGRVANPATGKSSLVTLIPLEGPRTAGSRMSLSALRLIGASLTDLTEVAVTLAPEQS